MGSVVIGSLRGRYGSVLGKTWVLVSFVLAGFRLGLFPISSRTCSFPKD